MKRNTSSWNLYILIGVGVLCSSLIPIGPTPPNSADVASVLSTSTANSPFRTAVNYSQGSIHHDDILAALTVYLEARGESFAGKLAVAAVIRNRMNHKYHSDGTLKGTVLRAKQFEPWMRWNPEEIKFDPKNKTMQESLLAWKIVQDGRNIVEGAVLFYNPLLVKTPRWALLNQKVAKIGGHEFFTRHTI